MDSKFTENMRIVLPLIDIIAYAVRMAPEALAMYRLARSRIETMVAENRGPTAVEQAELNKLLMLVHQSIQEPINFPASAYAAVITALETGKPLKRKSSQQALLADHVMEDFVLDDEDPDL